MRQELSITLEAVKPLRHRPKVPESKVLNGRVPAIENSKRTNGAPVQKDRKARRDYGVSNRRFAAFGGRKGPDCPGRG